MESNRDLLTRCRQTVSEIEALIHSTHHSALLDDAFLRLRFVVKEVTRRFENQADVERHFIPEIQRN